tara:strand:+ start:2441 stop:2749 length:309 start_codon:yes stop_codon:yes gene_type:complete
MGTSIFEILIYLKIYPIYIMTTMETLNLINRMPLCNDTMNFMIKKYVKYDILQKTYDKQKKEVVNHLQYYMWLKKKINKKDNVNKSLLEILQGFDYYKKRKV